METFIFVMSVISGIAGGIKWAPQCWKAFKYHNGLGLSKGMLILAAVDEIASLIVMIHLGVIPLIIKYIFEAVCVAILYYYKVKGNNTLDNHYKIV